MSQNQIVERLPVQSKEVFEQLITKLGKINEQVPKTEVIRDEIIFPPQIEDLYRLYRLVRDAYVISAIEYGAGWSTLALSVGIWENKMNFGSAYVGNRNSHPFELHSVDASDFFLDKAIFRVTERYRSVVKAKPAKPILHIGSSQCAVLWSPAQRVDYDLIYIDGPEPEQVIRKPNDFPVATLNDLPIMGDLVLYEDYILPKTLVIFDGRTSNFRSYIHRFRRNWKWYSSERDDFSLMYLDERPIGAINRRHLEFRERHSHILLENIQIWENAPGER